jgi:hypothetical protein
MAGRMFSILKGEEKTMTVKAKVKPTRGKSGTVGTGSQTPDSLDHANATASRAELDRLIHNIKAKQSKVAKQEGDIVSNLVRIGVLLIELQSAAGRTWQRQVEKLGYHPRTASRLQKIALSWQGEIGTAGSEILSRLPTDLQKLEWLSRLSREQLGTLLAWLDLKKASRNEVTAAVKELLGATAATRTKGSVVKVINQLFTRMAKVLAGWHQAGNGEETPEQLRVAFHSGVQELQQALDNVSEAPMRQSVPVQEPGSHGADSRQEAPSC